MSNIHTDPNLIDVAAPHKLNTKSKAVRWLRHVSQDALILFSPEGTELVQGFHDGYYVCHDRRTPNAPMDMIFFDVRRSIRSALDLKVNPVLKYGNTLGWLEDTALEGRSVAYERISKMGPIAVLDLYIFDGTENPYSHAPDSLHKLVQRQSFSVLAKNLDSGCLMTVEQFGSVQKAHYRVASEPLGQPLQFPDVH